MITSMLDTRYETALRVLLLLQALGTEATAEYLATIDTLAINAKTFGLSELNLNGTHRLAAGEIPRRIQLMQEALKILAVRRLVTYSSSNEGTWCLTSSGIAAANALDTAYANDYYLTLLEVLEQTEGFSPRELSRIVTTALGASK